MSVREMFHEELILLSEVAKNESELFDKSSKLLYEKGFVNKDYKNGLIEREKKFPTGLATNYLNIALPHSDTRFVEKPFIYIVRIQDPVIVRQMGDNREIKVRDFLFLGIKDPTKQVGLLQLLMELFQDKQFVEELKSLNDKKFVYQLFTKKISKPEAV